MTQNNNNLGSIKVPNKSTSYKSCWYRQDNNTLRVDIPNFESGEQSFPIVQGSFNGMDKITFLNSYIGELNFGAGGTYRSMFPTYGIEGKHFDSISELIFKKFVVTFPALNNWITDGVEIVRDSDVTALTIPKPKVLLEIEFGDLSKLKLVQGFNRDSNRKRITIEKTSFFEITSAEGIDIDVVWSIVTSLRRLVLFLTHKDPSYSKLLLFKTLAEGESGLKVKRFVQSVNENNFSMRFDIDHNGIKEHLPKLIKEWLENEKLETIYGAIQEKYFNQDMSFKNYLFGLSIAIETFHEQFGKITGKEVDVINKKKDHKKIKDLVKKEFPDLSKWFLSNTGNLSKPTYIERLSTYHLYFELMLLPHIGGELKSLLTKVKQYRNEFAHTGESSRFDSVEVILVSKSLEYLLLIETMMILTGGAFEKEFFCVKGGRYISGLASMNNYNKKHKRI